MKIPTSKAYSVLLKAQRGKQFYYPVEDPKFLKAISSEMKVQNRMVLNKIKPIK
jgi:hypothetical protein